MPCPYFEPQHPAVDTLHAGARLPLLDEYDGLCRASGDPFTVPVENRFRCCNHGYSKGCCRHFPATESRSSSRYDVKSRAASQLDVMCVEEKDYAPVRWHLVRYFADGCRLEPEIEDSCVRAQLLAFCRSYLARFPE